MITPMIYLVKILILFISWTQSDLKEKTSLMNTLEQKVGQDDKLMIK